MVKDRTNIFLLENPKNTTNTSIRKTRQRGSQSNGISHQTVGELPDDGWSKWTYHDTQLYFLKWLNIYQSSSVATPTFSL